MHPPTWRARRAGRWESDRINWHQSLSDRHWPRRIQDLETMLQRALNVLAAPLARLVFTRILSDNGHRWIEGDRTKDFRALLLAIRGVMAARSGQSGRQQSARFPQLQGRLHGFRHPRRPSANGSVAAGRSAAFRMARHYLEARNMICSDCARVRQPLPSQQLRIQRALTPRPMLKFEAAILLAQKQNPHQRLLMGVGLNK